jgi:hypothetical protein
MNQIINISAFTILTLLWLGFGVAIILKKELLDNAWKSFRRLPLVIQLVLAFLLLPIVLGLWIWQTTWPFWLRLALVIGLALITIYTFFPHLPVA